MAKNKIENKIGEMVYKTLDEIKEFQGDLKELPEESYKKLRTSFFNHGNIAPVFIWQDKILDGHQRVKTLQKLRDEGVSVPDKIPCVEIQATSQKQAKRFLLQYVSQQGKVTEAGLYDYLFQAELLDDLEELKLELDIPSIDLDGLHVQEVGLPELADGDKEPFQQRTFTLHDQQAEIVDKAIALAKSSPELDTRVNENSNGNALGLICSKWLEAGNG